MNSLGAHAHEAVAVPSQAKTAPDTETDAGHLIVRWFASFFAQPYSKAAVAARMSGQTTLGDPASLGDALETVPVG